MEGTVDLAYEERDGFVVIDFKTDRPDDEVIHIPPSGGLVRGRNRACDRSTREGGADDGLGVRAKASYRASSASGRGRR